MLKYEMLGLVMVSTSIAIPQDIPSDKSKVAEAIRETLLNDPELLQQALNNLAVYQQRKSAEHFKSKYNEIKGNIEIDTGNIVGDKASDKLIVVFSDYNCKYCAKLAKFIKDNQKSGYKFAVKELPILNASSEMVARYAILAAKFGIYEKFYFLSYESPHSTEDDMRGIIKELGMEDKMTPEEAQKPWVSEAIAYNRKIAASLDIGATPTLIYQGNKLENGLVDISKILGKSGVATQ